MLKQATLSWNARQLGKMVGKNEVVFDHAVQRRLVWDNDRKSLLIHSMIYGYPIPFMYMINVNDKYSVIEGKQRANCIHDFLNDEFTLTNVPEITLEDGTELDINGMKFSELPEEIRDTINNYSLTIAYFDNITDDEVSELFFRLNNSKALSSIEHMRCLSPSLRIIQQIGQHELFTAALTEKAFEKYTHEDMVIKSYIMLTHKEPAYDTKYVKPVMETAKFTEEDINNLNAIYDRILAVYKAIVADTSTETGKLSKKIAKRVITRTHMLSIIPIVKKSIDDGVSIELFTAWVKNFFCGAKSPTKYDQYNSKATSGSGHAESVKSRLNVINKDYNKFMKEHKDDVFKKVEAKEEKVVETTEEKVEEVVDIVTETITETVEEITTEETIKSVDTATKVETEEVTTEVVEETNVETETTEEVEEIDILGITEEDDIPDNIKAILEAAEEAAEELEEAIAEAV